MNLFHKRPLCLILCIMLGGFCFSVGFGTVPAVVVASASFGFLIATFIFKGLLSGRIVLTRIVLIALIVVILLGLLFNYLFYPTEYFESEVKIKGQITYADHTSSSYSTVVIRTSEINGSRDRHSITVSDAKDLLSGLNAGDVIEAKITLLPLRDNDTKSYYVSKGYSARGDLINSISVIERDVKDFTRIFSELRGKVCDRLRNLTDKRTGDFLSALLTGERVAVEPSIALAFSRTGTTHILALSGAHLVMLSFAISFVLKAIKIGRRARTVITALAVIFYVPFTGMSASVTRAGVMLLISSFIYLISRNSDGPTTLSLSIFFIILFEPYAIYDVALWLSALATLGLILLSSLSKKRGKKGSLLKEGVKKFISAALASVFAISASLVISLLLFDGFSVLALPATLILSVLTEILLYLSLIALLFGGIIPFKAPLLFLSNITFDITDWFSKFEYSYIPFDFLPVRIISVILVLAVLSILVFNLKKHKRAAILSVTAIFILLNTVGIVQSAVVKNQNRVVYTPDERCNVISIRSGGEYTVIASGCAKNNVTDIVSAAKRDKITRIDTLIIPSYTYYTIEEVNQTVSNILVDTVMLPAPLTSEESTAALYVAELLSEFSTRLRFIDEGEKISVADGHFTLHFHSQMTSSVLLNSFTVTVAERNLLYLSADCILDNHNPSIDAFDTADIIIIGNDKYASGRIIDFMPNNASTVYFGADFKLSSGSDRFFKEKGVSAIYTNTPLNID